MPPPAPQHTLRRAVERRGRGLHTGAETTVRLYPAATDHGRVFVRVDLPEQPEIRVTSDAIAPRPRCSAVRRGEAEVMTVEHLLSALFMLGVANCRIEIDGPELPGLDGSALRWVEALDEAGLAVQDAPRRCYRVTSALSYSEGEVHVVALPHDGALRVTYTLDYPNGPIRPQFFSRELDAASYRAEIAPARTFCLEAEAQALLAAGLGRGATTENTLVIGPDGAKDNVFRLPDEPVRHKVLDLLGDLALLGVDLQAHVMAARSGHGANLALVRRLARRIQEDEEEGRLEYPSRLDVAALRRLLPHRYPFLLVDRVIELEDERRAVGLKNVTINEPFFQGHFPDRPIMPGVLQVEAMAQLAGALLARRVAAGEVSLAYLTAIDKCRFRRMVVPGDTLRLEAVADRMKRRTAQVSCRALVRGEVAAEAQIRFMIVG